MQEIKVRLTFTEEILGTAAADKEIHKTYIASLAPNAPSKKEEVEAVGVEETIEKAMTVSRETKRACRSIGTTRLRDFSKMRPECCVRFRTRKARKLRRIRKRLTG